jgi:mono/diheme cytochrome c family protein
MDGATYDPSSPFARSCMRLRSSLVTCLIVLAGSAVPAAAQGSAVAAASGAPYTAEQAARGEAVYKRACAECHATSDHANPDFRFSWNGRTALELFENIRNTMPEENPGSLSRQEYADIVAYMMKLNGMPSGPRPLAPDSTSLRAARLDVRATRSR